MAASLLKPEQLFRPCDPDRLVAGRPEGLGGATNAIGQERAAEASRLALRMRQEGFNLFVMGPSGCGKRSLVRRALEPFAEGMPAHSDWCYVNNFADPSRPRALRLSSGTAAPFRQDMRELMKAIPVKIGEALDSDEIRRRREAIDGVFHAMREAALQRGKDFAQQRGVSVAVTPEGFAVAPTRDGRPVRQEEFESLPAQEQEQTLARVAQVQEEFVRIFQQIAQGRLERNDKIEALKCEVAASVVAKCVSEVASRYAGTPAVADHLDAVRADLLERGADVGEQPHVSPMGPGDSDLGRYEVNIVSIRGAGAGAPVVRKDHPTYPNLVGRVEHVSQFGALVTNFTLIKGGALHRANGGYLLMDARQLLMQPFSWEGLKRALRIRELRMDGVPEMLGLAAPASLEPEPIPLVVKVILFGDRLTYYLLYQADPEFRDHFKVVADVEDDVPRTPQAELLYARLIEGIAHDQGLVSPQRAALARLVEHGSRLAGDAQRLSCRLGEADIAREADHRARLRGGDSIGQADIQAAVEARISRADRLRQRLRQEILDGRVLIDTQGRQVGQVNAMAVVNLGNFVFAHPARVTATARLGSEGVIDIEREVELGGATHSKGVLILAQLLASRYAAHQPLSLSASIAFEQTYTPVEGDSASLAELCALISVLAGLPVSQHLAVTGSINQRGQVQAVGAINEKIEGFFDLCNARGLTGDQGVVIPSSNVSCLMLRPEVVAAAQAGSFKVFAVADVDQAMELLTGLQAGVPDMAGRLAPLSVNGRVEARLGELARIRRRYARAAHPIEADRPSRSRPRSPAAWQAGPR